MEDVLGVDAIISQMIEPGHIFLVNTEGLAFKTAVEDQEALETYEYEYESSNLAGTF